MWRCVLHQFYQVEFINIHRSKELLKTRFHSKRRPTLVYSRTKNIIVNNTAMFDIMSALS